MKIKIDLTAELLGRLNLDGEPGKKRYMQIPVIGSETDGFHVFFSDLLIPPAAIALLEFCTRVEITEAFGLLEPARRNGYYSPNEDNRNLKQKAVVGEDSRAGWHHRTIRVVASAAAPAGIGTALFTAAVDFYGDIRNGSLLPDPGLDFSLPQRGSGGDSLKDW